MFTGPKGSQLRGGDITDSAIAFDYFKPLPIWLSDTSTGNR